MRDGRTLARFWRGGQHGEDVELGFAPVDILIAVNGGKAVGDELSGAGGTRESIQLESEKAESLSE